MRLITAVAGIVLIVAAAVVTPSLVHAGEGAATGYSLLSPIRSGNLTVFPVVSGKSLNNSYDTAQFLTLDEGLRSGDVVVTEAGQARGLIRHRPGDRDIVHPLRDAEVNRLEQYAEVEVYAQEDDRRGDRTRGSPPVITTSQISGREAM